MELSRVPAPAVAAVAAVAAGKRRSPGSPIRPDRSASPAGAAEAEAEVAAEAQQQRQNCTPATLAANGLLALFTEWYAPVTGLFRREKRVEGLRIEEYA